MSNLVWIGVEAWQSFQRVTRRSTSLPPAKDLVNGQTSLRRGRDSQAAAEGFAERTGFGVAAGPRRAQGVFAQIRTVRVGEQRPEVDFGSFADGVGGDW